MQTHLWPNVIRFVFLILLQGIALEHIDIPGNLHLLVYPIFVLLLPLQTPKVLLLLLGFICGLVVDILTGVPGLNAAALTLMAFARILYFRIVKPKDVLHDAELTGTPLPGLIGHGNFFAYSAWMLLLFHFFYFFLEVFSFRNFFYTIYLIVGSTALCFGALYITISVFRSKSVTR